MKVGINLPSQFPFGSTVQMMEVYEQVGFDSYWSPDHILGVFHPALWKDIPLSDLAADPDAFYDPFCYGAVVGTMTDKPVRHLGHRRHPARCGRPGQDRADA